MTKFLLYKKMLHNIKAVAFDLDGTLYFQNSLFEGVIELLTLIKSKGINTFYFTNNSFKSRSEIFSKLANLGVNLSLEEVYTSSYATAIYAKENNIKRVHCIGGKGLIQELESKEIAIFNNGEQVDAIIVGLDPEFSYDKISYSLMSLNKGCRLIACNRDRNYPIGNNILLPGCGPLIAAIEYASGVEADYVVGKPNTYMLEILLKAHKLNNTEILIVGDTYESDIEMAKRCGCPAALIASNKFAHNQDDVLSLNNTKDLKLLFE
jgi:HAD superfamily hydrolase (TIGR01450 family)